MITVLFYATVKEDNVQTFHDQVVRLTAITRARMTDVDLCVSSATR